MVKRRTIVKLDEHGEEIHRGPGRPRTKPPRAPSLRVLGVSADLAERIALSFERLAAGDELPYEELNDIARLTRATAERAKAGDRHRSNMLKGVARPRNEFLVQRTLDGEAREWRYKTNGEAAERVGLTDLTLRQYLATDIGGPRGQWSSERGGVEWYVTRVPIGSKSGTEHAAQTKPGTNTECLA